MSFARAWVAGRRVWDVGWSRILVAANSGRGAGGGPGYPNLSGKAPGGQKCVPRSATLATSLCVAALPS